MPTSGDDILVKHWKHHPCKKNLLIFTLLILKVKLFKRHWKESKIYTTEWKEIIYGT
jgi:hypothetical protein